MDPSESSSHATVHVPIVAFTDCVVADDDGVPDSPGPMITGPVNEPEEVSPQIRSNKRKRAMTSLFPINTVAVAETQPCSAPKEQRTDGFVIIDLTEDEQGLGSSSKRRKTSPRVIEDVRSTADVRAARIPSLSQIVASPARLEPTLCQSSMQASRYLDDWNRQYERVQFPLATCDRPQIHPVCQGELYNAETGIVHLHLISRVRWPYCLYPAPNPYQRFPSLQLLPVRSDHNQTTPKGCDARETNIAHSSSTTLSNGKETPLPWTQRTHEKDFVRRSDIVRQAPMETQKHLIFQQLSVLPYTSQILAGS